jgi:predicted MPP superfamily phosphohydrolase
MASISTKDLPPLLPSLAHPTDFDPDLYYSLYHSNMPILSLPLMKPLPPKPDGHLRIVMISDTHKFHRLIPHMEADILIHAGDLTNTGEPEQIQDFVKWMSELTHIKHKVVIVGNHDLTFDKESYPKIWPRFHRKMFDIKSTRKLFKNAPFIYLENSGCEIEGRRYFLLIFVIFV